MDRELEPSDVVRVGLSLLHSLDREAADLFVLHRCVELSIEEAATWVGVSPMQARQALDRCDRHIDTVIE